MPSSERDRTWLAASTHEGEEEAVLDAWLLARRHHSGLRLILAIRHPQRGDAVGPHNTLAAQRKAFTALSTRTPTRQLAERARSEKAQRYKW